MQSFFNGVDYNCSTKDSECEWPTGSSGDEEVLNTQVHIIYHFTL